jgi:flagellar biosynthesis protein FlhB
MADVDHEQKTEQASPRRRERSREQGEAVRSTDVVAAAVLLGCLGVLGAAGGDLVARLASYARDLLGHLDRGTSVTSLHDTLSLLGRVAMPVSAAGAACALGAGLAQSQGAWSLQPLAPDWKRLDPFRRFGELFLSSHALVEVGKSLVKFAVVGLVAVTSLRAALSDLAARPPASAAEAIRATVAVLMSLGLRVALAFAVIAAADWVVERFRFERRLRMSRHELKEEMREEEGDPLLRRRRRQRHRELARRRALLDVPLADVVLVNPTEYAVALRYDAGRMRAPRIVAKGRLHLAERIREIARGAGVPIVREPPLARLLYHSVEIGREIPVSVYRAVAEILAYVYRIRRGAPVAARPQQVVAS